MRITVVGDVLLDEDVSSTSSRLCPDAAVPVLDVASTASRAGGAGLVATMLRGDGHEVELVTALGDDAEAEQLRALLEGISLVACPSGAPTPVKSRLSSNGQLVCRVDRGCGEAPAPRVDSRVLRAIERATAIVVADYGRGLTADPGVRRVLHDRGREVPVVWDPHPRGADPVPASWLITPNLAEAAAATGTDATIGQASVAARRLRERTGCRAVAVTLGEHGALLQEEEGEPMLFPTMPAAETDPCGAGDRFAATAIAMLANGADIPHATQAAVDSASAYLDAGGVGSLDSARLPRRSEAGADAQRVVRGVRARGGTVVATGGCFDLLHAGHVRTLEAARALGDCLVVCLNSDASVRRLKGPERPLIRAEDRAELLVALACVDAVVVFDEDGPETVLERLRPDIWVKGGDYSVDSLPEARVLERWGGRTITLPYHLGRSTTGLAAALAKVS